MVTWEAPSADKVSKILLKVVQEDFGNDFFFSVRGGGTTPQMLLTVKLSEKAYVINR